jgi:hypothetical protein
MFKLIKNELLGPEDAGGGSVTPPPVEMNQHDLENFLKDEEGEGEGEPETLDLKPEKIKSPEKEEVKEDEEKEDDEESDESEEDEETLEDELEKDLEEPDEDKLEEPTDIPASRKEMLAKYPKLFKDFPQLEKAFYREQKYTEIFPTIKDAEASQDKAQTWDKLESQLQQGEIAPILEAVAQGDKNSFYRMVDELIPTLNRIDKDVVTHIYSGVIKEVITEMVAAGSKQGNEGLKAAAQLVHQFVYGPKEFQPHGKLAQDKPKDDPRAKELDNKQREFFQRQFNQAKGEITTKVENVIKATIERNIDPKESMSEYVKTKAVGDVFADVQEAIKTDKRFQAVITRLWEKAAKSDFAENDKQAIRSAILSKARQLLLPAIQKGRKTALGGRTEKPKANGSEPVKTGPQERKTPGKSATPNSGKSYREQAKAIPRDVSTRSFLERD